MTSGRTRTGAVDLGQAVFLGVDVEHELRQRPVQARDRA
jgi:hypothetical protein